MKRLDVVLYHYINSHPEEEREEITEFLFD